MKGGGGDSKPSIFQWYRDLVEMNKHIRIKIEKKFIQEGCGVYVHVGLATISFMSSVLYIVTYFYPTFHIQFMKDYFDTCDKIICIMLLVQYSLSLYVTMQRSVYILSIESLLCLFIMVPILTNEDLS